MSNPVRLAKLEPPLGRAEKVYLVLWRGVEIGLIRKRNDTKQATYPWVALVCGKLVGELKDKDAAVTAVIRASQFVSLSIRGLDYFIARR